jgi:hypothetical protein
MGVHASTDGGKIGERRGRKVFILFPPQGFGSRRAIAKLVPFMGAIACLALLFTVCMFDPIFSN